MYDKCLFFNESLILHACAKSMYQASPRGGGGGLGMRLGHSMLIMKELPHELVQSDGNGTDFSNDMREKVPVSSDSRVAFQETLCEVVGSGLSCVA